MKQFICEFCNSPLTNKEYTHWYCNCKGIIKGYCDSYFITPLGYFFKIEFVHKDITFNIFYDKYGIFCIHNFKKITIQTNLFEDLFENKIYCKGLNKENVSFLMNKCQSILDNLIFE